MSTESDTTNIAAAAFGDFVATAKAHVQKAVEARAAEVEQHRLAVETAKKELAELTAQRDAVAAEKKSLDAAIEAIKAGGGEALGRAAETVAYMATVLPAPPRPDGNCRELTAAFLLSRGWRRMAGDQWNCGGGNASLEAAVQSEIRNAFAVGAPLLTAAVDRQQPNTPAAMLGSRLIRPGRWLSPEPLR